MTVYTPNLPALITGLPGDHTRAPQTEFTRARQVLFLENLSVTGSVRSAASAAQVSHQTAYRARRATAAFRTAWDAALVVARAAASDTLACRAIDGITEDVLYHGEGVATRTRYSDRLLLAHLARLDRLVENAQANAFAEDFDDALARFERGEEPVPATPGSASETAESLSPGPCNTRSMSNKPDDGEQDEDDGIDWEDEDACAAELARIKAAMEADRPPDAPRLTGVGPDGQDRDPHGLIADAQWEAFARRVPRWWLVVPPAPGGGKGEWHYAEADAKSADPLAPCEEPMRPDDHRPEPEPDSEPKPEFKSEPEQEVEHEFEPQPEPGPAPASTPAGTPRADGARWTWSPVDDGRLQPFYGRYL